MFNLVVIHYMASSNHAGANLTHKNSKMKMNSLEEAKMEIDTTENMVANITTDTVMDTTIETAVDT
jgi:hypothetical protein